jgi:iron complex outermembrane receptor protein
MLLPSFVIDQQITLKGNVIDNDSNESLSGVTLLIKGTSLGTSTDFDGNFTIISKVGDTLVVSILVMKTQEIVILINCFF